jgi:hypothetical protein
MLRALLSVAALALGVGFNVPSGLAGEPYENQWGPFYGTVVEAESSRPVTGAVIVVIWREG